MGMLVRPVQRVDAPRERVAKVERVDSVGEIHDIVRGVGAPEAMARSGDLQVHIEWGLE